MAEQVTQNHRVLKAAVIIMGVLIVIGTIALIAGLIMKAGEVSEAIAPRADFGRVAVPAGPGERIDSFSLIGNRLVLKLAGEGGGRVIVVDLAGGRLLGEVLLDRDAGRDGVPGTVERQ